MKKQFLFCLMFIASTFISSTTKADTHCFCVASSDDLNNKKSPTSVLKDWPITTTWKTAHLGAQKDCRQLCSNVASNSSDVGANACAKNVETGKEIRAYAAVGTRDYANVKNLGKVTRSGPDLACPSGSELVKPGASNFHSSAGFTNTAYCAKTMDMGCPQGYIAESWSGGVKCVLKTVPSTVGSGSCKVE